MIKTLTHTMKKALLPAPLILMLLLYIPIPAANAQETTLEVNPSSLVVGEAGVLPTDPFIINITVTDVTDLYDWQILLYFNNSVLSCTEDMMWLPADHVFAGKTYVESEKVIGLEPSGPYPIVPYILYGCSLFGVGDTFTGSGTLCQINFTGIALGTSSLTFLSLGEDTILDDSEGTPIDFTAVDGEVTVIPEFPAVILIPVIMILTLVAVTIGKRSWPNKH